MTINVYQFSRNSLKFPILTKILILKSIIVNKIDQLIFYKSYAGACKENIFSLDVSQLCAAKTLTCKIKLYVWCFPFKLTSSNRLLSYVCMMFSDVSCPLILFLCSSIIELATTQFYCAQNILGIGLYMLQLKCILIFEFPLLHFFFTLFSLLFNLLF